MAKKFAAKQAKSSNDLQKDAKKAYESKVTGKRWKPGVDKAIKNGNYCKGVTHFLGVSDSKCDTEKETHWRDRVEAVSASDFDADVRNAFETWLAGYGAAMTD